MTQGPKEGAEEEGRTRPHIPLPVLKPNRRRKRDSCMSPDLERPPVHPTTKLKLRFSRAREIGVGYTPAEVQVSGQAHPGGWGRAAGQGAPETAGPSLAHVALLEMSLTLGDGTVRFR